MTDLTHVRTVIGYVAAGLQADTVKERQGIKSVIKSMFSKGLISFDEIFTSFTAAVGQSADLYDRWLGIQMRIWTDLGPEREELCKQFTDMVAKVMKETDGGHAFVHHPDSNKLSYVCALMIRVYLDQLVVSDVPEEEGEGE